MTKSKKKLNFIFKKAAVTMAVFFLSQAYADKVNIQEHIKKAQNATLQQDRLRAIQILSNGINGVTDKGDKKILFKQLDKLSGLFYSEEVQKKYLLARSTFLTNQTQSLETLKDIEVKEPKNSSIKKALIVNNLYLKKCKKASAKIDELEVLNPYEKNIFLYKMDSAYCEADWNKFKLLKKNLTKGGAPSHSAINIISLYNIAINNKVYIQKWSRVPASIRGDGVVYDLIDYLASNDPGAKLSFAKKYVNRCEEITKIGPELNSRVHYECDSLSLMKNELSSLKEQQEVSIGK